MKQLKKVVIVLIIGRPITKGNPKENIKNILSSID